MEVLTNYGAQISNLEYVEKSSNESLGKLIQLNKHLLRNGEYFQPFHLTTELTRIIRELIKQDEPDNIYNHLLFFEDWFIDIINDIIHSRVNLFLIDIISNMINSIHHDFIKNNLDIKTFWYFYSTISNKFINTLLDHGLNDNCTYLLRSLIICFYFEQSYFYPHEREIPVFYKAYRKEFLKKYELIEDEEEIYRKKDIWFDITEIQDKILYSLFEEFLNRKNKHVLISGLQQIVSYSEKIRKDDQFFKHAYIYKKVYFLLREIVLKGYHLKIFYEYDDPLFLAK
ncbi:MAG: hypothetical protein K8R58_10550 [Bacteroidales bacterium]|nr:hypothetical protein [Bacteroidales bacterium]